MTATVAPSPATTFCGACIASSSNDSPRDVSTSSGIGRKFYGGAERCPDCGSVVRTLWFVIADVPLIPRGSFRYLPVGAERNEGFFVQTATQSFLARRTALNWRQVGATWAIGALGIAAFFVFRWIISR